MYQYDRLDRQLKFHFKEINSLKNFYNYDNELKHNYRCFFNLFIKIYLPDILFTFTD